MQSTLKTRLLTRVSQRGRFGLWVLALCFLPLLSPAHSNSEGSNLTLAMQIALAELEAELGTKLIVTSGYRPPTHPLEAVKAKPGTHAQGIAVDIACSSGPNLPSCELLASVALNVGFDGIGMYDRHVHVDLRGYPARWSGTSK